MNWDNLQNRMQREASQKEVKVDIDEIWTAIEPEVDIINQKRRKKGFFFFWMLGLGLVLAVGGLFYLFNNNTVANESLVDFEKMERKTEEHSHSHAHAHAESQLENEDHKNIVPNESKESSVNSTELDFVQEKLNSNNQLGNSSTKKEKAVNNNVNQVIGSTNEKRNTKEKLPWKISQSDQKIQSTNELDNSDLILSNNQKEKSNSVIQVGGKIIGKDLLDISKLSMLTLVLPTVEKDFLPTRPISNYYTALTKEEIDRILKKRKYGQPKFTFSFGLMGGIGSAPNTLTTKNDTISSLLLIRRETESSLETSQFGLAFSLRHENGLHLSTGLQQTTFVEKVAFDDSITEEKLIDGIIEIIVGSNGDSTYVYGLIPETKVTTIEKRQYVRYKLLEVPLIVGWQTKDKNDTGWTFGVEGGIVPNLTLTTKGRIFNENYEDVDVGINQADYFKKNIGLSYHLGFSVRRMLGQNIELSFKPTVRFFPKDFSVDGNNISQKYNLVSGQVGVNYIFGN